MAKYFLTSLAENDLKDIFIYTANKWGLNQADKYLHEMDAYMQKIANGEIVGKDCSKLISQQNNLKYYHANRHYIIYRKSENITEIITLYHDKMNIEHHLSKI